LAPALGYVLLAVEEYFEFSVKLFALVDEIVVFIDETQEPIYRKLDVYQSSQINFAKVF
jgi:hypothetical protein